MLKTVTSALVCLVSAAILGGCASTPTGEVFSSLVEPPDPRGLLYVYRLNEYHGGGLKFKVAIDG